MRLTHFYSMVAYATIIASIQPARAQSQSWIDPSVLATDPTAYCTDIVAPQTQVDRGSIQQNNIYSRQTENHRSRQQASSSYRERSGGGGIKFLGIGANAHGGSKRSQSSKLAYRRENKDSLHRDTSSSSSWDNTRITNEAVGINCDAFVESAAHVEATKINADVNRELIRSQEKLKRQVIETNRHAEDYNTLLQLWHSY